MSTKAEEEEEEEEEEEVDTCCASCGVAAIDHVKLIDCDGRL